MNLIELHGLTHSYDGVHPALQVESFTLRQGEKVALLGANGAGKSTFLLCLNGVLRAGGTVRYRGEAITRQNVNTLRRNVGIVFQSADRQIVASTVAADVSFGPMNLGLSRDDVARQVEGALAAMNLVQLRDRPPHYLSGGEKKRVSIAGVLAMEPEVIIFDEPTANLDPANVALLERTLAMLAADGKTLMIATHDVDFVWRWAERAVILSGGRVIADGRPQDVMGDAALLRQSNMAAPTLLDVHRILRRAGLADGDPPRTLPDLERIIERSARA